MIWVFSGHFLAGVILMVSYSISFWAGCEYDLSNFSPFFFM